MYVVNRGVGVAPSRVNELPLYRSQPLGFSLLPEPLLRPIVVESALDRVTAWVEQNKTAVMIGAGALVGLVVLKSIGRRR